MDPLLYIFRLVVLPLATALFFEKSNKDVAINPEAVAPVIFPRSSTINRNVDNLWWKSNSTAWLKIPVVFTAVIKSEALYPVTEV